MTNWALNFALVEIYQNFVIDDGAKISLNVCCQKVFSGKAHKVWAGLHNI